MSATYTVVIGAGPAGLTAAYELVKAGQSVVALEASDTVGGLSQTVERDGWRFDIGGHRFFTKVPEVEALWHDILPPEDFLMRPRMSRIYYNGRFFDYPLKAMNALRGLKAMNALRGLGVAEAARCVLSYALARIRPPKDQTTFEGWVAARFGWRLYRIFFKTYTEKVWGMEATEIQADWAAQRIKNLNLMTAVRRAVFPRRNRKDVASLIEEFQYPKYGPGLMWERCRSRVEELGGEVRMRSAVHAVRHQGGRAIGVAATTERGIRVYEADHVVSSMPLSTLVKVMDPPAPKHVQEAADGLRYRDFLTVALVVPQRFSFPDNWIYIHSPGVKVGRIQNFGSWSPYLVKNDRTCLGLEYFVNEGDELWNASDDELIALGKRELAGLGLVNQDAVEAGYVVRMPKAYPVYDADYKGHVEAIRAWLAEVAPNVHPVGRNGMHKYNNQDHSMLTAMLTAQNILGNGRHDIWQVNVEEDYHEEQTGKVAGGSAREGTGREAPLRPRRQTAT